MEHKVCLMLRFNDLTKSSGDNIMGFCGYVVDTISGASPWILATQDSRLKTQDSRLKTQDSRLKAQDSRLKTHAIFINSDILSTCYYAEGFSRCALTHRPLITPPR